MFVWEITFFLESEYEEQGDLSFQEKYHSFINKILSTHDMTYQVEILDWGMIISFAAATREDLDTIIATHQHIFQNLPPREEPLEMKLEIYELL